MDELGGKIITGIVIAVLIFILQNAGIHKLIAGIFGVENLLTSNTKEEKIYWASIEKCGTKECYQLYLDKYPEGSFVGIASVYLKDKKIISAVEPKTKGLWSSPSIREAANDVVLDVLEKELNSSTRNIDKPEK